jgi:hypothetical protein
MVILVKITITSAKNDVFRAGRTMFYSAEQDACGIAVCRILFEWSKTACLSANDRLFSLPHPSSRKQRLNLSYDHMRKALKECARSHNLSPEDFSTHSLRIGGACALFASGSSPQMVMFMGRWRTLPSCLGYVEVTLRDFDHAQWLINKGVLTTEDVRLLTMRSVAATADSENSDVVDYADDDVEDHMAL